MCEMLAIVSFALVFLRIVHLKSSSEYINIQSDQGSILLLEVFEVARENCSTVIVRRPNEKQNN